MVAAGEAKVPGPLGEMWRDWASCGAEEQFWELGVQVKNVGAGHKNVGAGVHCEQGSGVWERMDCQGKDAVVVSGFVSGCT